MGDGKFDISRPLYVWNELFMHLCDLSERPFLTFALLASFA